MLHVKNETAQHTSVALPVYGSAFPQSIQLPAMVPALPVAPQLPLEASCPRNNQIFLCEDNFFFFLNKLKTKRRANAWLCLHFEFVEP